MHKKHNSKTNYAKMKRIEKIIIFLSLIINTLSLTAQTLQVEGNIWDADKKEVVPFASVAVVNTSFAATTNEQGFFSLVMPIETAQIANLVVSCVGYKNDTISLKKWLKKDESKLFLKVFLQNSQQIFSEVVVTGTMKERIQMDSPVPIEVYTPTFFKRNPTPNLFSALENINGVRPQLNCSVCNTGDIHINGMEGGYTMVMIDGMPIVSALATVYGLMGIPNAMVQRIEVIKGPASTLYGSEAVGGLINVITKNPNNAPLFSVDVNTSGYQELNIDVSTKAKMKRATMLLSANYFNFDKLWDINQDNFTDVTLQKRFSIFNKWNFERKYNRLSSIALRYFTENRWGGALQWNELLRGSDSVYGESIYTNRFELIGKYQLPTDEKLMLSYSYNVHQQNSFYGTTPYEARQQIGFTQLTWDKNFTHHDILAGLAFRYTFYDDNTTATEQPSNILLPGVFVQDEIRFSEIHKVLIGLRYDYNSAHGSIFTPRLNYQWKASEQHNFRLSLGNGYRIVNVFSEDHAALTGARKVEMTEALRPERSYNVNLNYTNRTFFKGGFLNFDASIFYTHFTNRIVADYDTDPNKIIYDNLKGFAISKGLTLNSDWNFTNGLKIMAGVTLMDVYTQEHNAQDEWIKTRQLHASPFSGTWTVSYALPKWNINFDYTGNFYSPMRLPILPDDFRPEYSPWFSVQNVQMTKKWGNKIEIYGGIKNLLNFLPQNPIMRPFDPFDKQVNIDNPFGYTFDPNYGYAPLQGRRIFLGMRYQLN